MGLNSLLNEVIEKDSETDKSENENQKYEEDCDGEIIKSENAIDYSDINELSEDCPAVAATEQTDLEDEIPATKVEAQNSELIK